MAFLRSLLALAASIALTSGAAALGAMFGTGDWYRTLAKPPWNPPDWVFGPVWSFLYLSMAVAAWLVWRRRQHPLAWLSLGVYAVHLAFNAAWTYLFFGRHWMGIALAEILALDVLILLTLALFWRVHRVAGALFIPYFAWVSFAAFLNASLWWLNS